MKRIRKGRKFGTALFMPLFLTITVIISIGVIKAYAEEGEDETTYTLGSNGIITYKESENKVYYQRKHYSSGSGIKYYTQSFVISLSEASIYDNLNGLGAAGNDYSLSYIVSLDGSSKKYSEDDKTLDFYWFDSDPADDGYITTTYVLDGSIFTGLLDEAAHKGIYGELYIHHVFAVTGGSNDDSWHKDNKVTNNSPYYVYSDLLKIWWNNTEATHDSQLACLNIPVPFKKMCYVNTAYYNEYGEVVKQENERISVKKTWKKTVPYEITGYDGEEYISVEPGNMKDISGNTMNVVFIYNTDPYLKNDFPKWNMKSDMDMVNGNSIKAKDAADEEGLPGGFNKTGDNEYNFKVKASKAIEVILYIPVTLKQVPTPTPTEVPTEPLEPTPTPEETPAPTPTVTPTPKPTPTPTEPAKPKDAMVIIKYFGFDDALSGYKWLKTEMRKNREKDNGRYDYNTLYSVDILQEIKANGRTYKAASLDGIAYGYDSSVLVTGHTCFADIYNQGITGGISGFIEGRTDISETFKVSFRTESEGEFYTVFIFCVNDKDKNNLIIRYFDADTGDILLEDIKESFFNGSVVKWYGINGYLSWALNVPGISGENGIIKDKARYIPAFCYEGYGEEHTGDCPSGEKLHSYHGGSTGNIDSYYCVTCGKIKRSIYFNNSHQDEGAVTVIYDNGSNQDPYHNYTVYSDSVAPLRAYFIYSENTSWEYSDLFRDYDETYIYMYSYDQAKDTLWLKIYEDTDYGHSIMTDTPYKASGLAGGIVYIPCVQDNTQEPISISVISDNLKYVQNLNANKDIAQAVVGESFSYGSLGHEHDSSDFSLQIDGYNESVLVMFTFDVCTENGMRIKGGSWNRLYPGYYVPEDIAEGIYTIKAASFNNVGKIIYEAETEIEISGKIYGLELYSINSEAKDWKGVFRINGEEKYLYTDKYPDGIFDRDFDLGKRYRYGSGSENELGLKKTDADGRKVIDKYILPILDGTGPKEDNGGMLKSGYTWSFSLETFGSRMFDENARILITPEFYHISPDVERNRAAILYSKALDSGNVNFVRAGASFEAQPKTEYEDGESPVGGLEYPYNMRTDKKWTFSYSLPDIWYSIPEDFDLDTCLESRGGCTYHEEFFYEKGYIAVNFRIEAYDGEGRLIMTYSNTEENINLGMCDMWKMEGFETERTDCFGQDYELNEGDVIVVRIPGSTFNPKTGYSDPPTNISEENTIRRKEYI
ncbi:MAG: hypothetical protein IKP88_12395 [Lachnospiraceae bacterium]|nr:hypothetical protein [Lachnospiraceae bacterium]